MYRKPDFFTKHVMNPALELAMKLGISFFGSRVLTVHGRKTGRPYSTPVNPLHLDGERYLVAPRGETGWVRNIRASGQGELRLGRKREPIEVSEIDGEHKSAVIREYLRKWKWEAGQFFNGISAESDADALRAEAANHPVFRITPPTATS